MKRSRQQTNETGEQQRMKQGTTRKGRDDKKK